MGERKVDFAKEEKIGRLLWPNKPATLFIYIVHGHRQIPGHCLRTLEGADNECRVSQSQVLNKYYPPDFDPELLPRNRKPKDRQVLCYPSACSCSCLSIRGEHSRAPFRFPSYLYAQCYIAHLHVKLPACLL